MYKHTTEAVVCVTHSDFVLKSFCARVREYCSSIRRLGVDRIFEFGDARAILRPVNEGLYVRVEAQELVTFCGIQMLVQASLSTTTTVAGGTVEWRPAGGLFFEKTRDRVGNQQDRSSGE